LKSAIANIWEMPSDVLMRQYTELRDALPKANRDADNFFRKLAAASDALKGYEIVLTVPAAGEP
jgi:hypothetical protein